MRFFFLFFLFLSQMAEGKGIRRMPTPPRKFTMQEEHALFIQAAYPMEFQQKMNQTLVSR
jgi:hypothetical protein